MWLKICLVWLNFNGSCKSKWIKSSLVSAYTYSRLLFSYMYQISIFYTYFDFFDRQTDRPRKVDIEAPCPELENSANKICWLQWCRCIQNMSFTICSYKSYFRFYKILRCLASILLTFAFCLIWIFSCDQQLKEWPCHSVSLCPFSDLVISSMWTCGDLSCRFCSTGSPENQEHLEICGGTEYERRGMDMSRWRGILTFWRRMTMKLMEEPMKKRRMK